MYIVGRDIAYNNPPPRAGEEKFARKTVAYADPSRPGRTTLSRRNDVCLRQHCDGGTAGDVSRGKHDRTRTPENCHCAAAHDIVLRA